MKKSVLLLIVLLSTTYAFAQKYSFPAGYQQFLNTAFSGYNPDYVVGKSKEKEIKRLEKSVHLTATTGKDGKSQLVNASPRVGDKVLEFEGTIWFNISTGELLVSSNALGAQGRDRTSNGQGLERIMTVSNILRNVGGQVMNRNGFGNGRVQTVNMRF